MMTNLFPLIESSHQQLLHQFKETDDIVERYGMPFPIAVFGTLRQIPRPMGNTRRMYTKDPEGFAKGFVEHCTFSGIHAEFKENASGAVEVFFYKPENFEGVIPGVDSLEGFSPNRKRNGWCYHRTLMRIRLLPDDHSNELFDRGLGWNDDRDLRIPKEEWTEFPWAPAWIYTNLKANSDIQEMEEHPVIWEGRLS